MAAVQSNYDRLPLSSDGLRQTLAPLIFGEIEKQHVPSLSGMPADL